MKKTIIALSLASVFAAPTMAETIKVSDIQKHFDENGWQELTRPNGDIQITDANGNYVGVAKVEGGNYVFEDENTGEKVRVNKDTGKGFITGKGKISRIAVNDDTNYVPSVNPTPDTRDRINVSDVDKALKDGGVSVKDFRGGKVLIQNNKVIGNAKLVNGNYEVTDRQGNKVVIDSKTGEATINGTDKVVINDDTTTPNVNPIKPSVDPIKPIDADKPNFNRNRGLHGIAKEYGAELQTDNGVNQIRFSKGALTGVTIREDGMVVDKFGKNVVNVDQLEFDKNGNVVVKGEDKTPNNGGSKIDDATKIDVVKPINRDDKNINVRERQKITTSAIDKAAAEAGVVAKTVGDKTVFIKDNKVVAEGKVVDGQFVINGKSENDINIAIDGNGNANINGENVKIVDDSREPNVNPVIDPKKPDDVKPVSPIHVENEEAEKIIDDAANAISKEVDKRIGTAGAAAYNEVSAYATATDAKLANHESRIGSLEKDMQAMGNKMLVLEDRMDGVVASSHAITNARPVLNSAGQFGMGVGMGAAGSKQAIAIGGAYQISDNWSGTMSVNYETKGKVSNDQLSAGVGAQYIF